MTPEDYQVSYGLDWKEFPHPVGEIALLHLLATDLRVAGIILEQSGRRAFPFSVMGEEKLLITPDVRDGFIYIVEQQPMEMWLGDRMRRTGEKLKLVQN